VRTASTRCCGSWPRPGYAAVKRARSWDDCDLDAGVIFVRHNAVPVVNEIVIGSPKTRRSRRRVTIGADSVELLRGHLAAQREHRLAMGTGWRDLGLPRG
jgi:hypothetical protein